MSKPKVLILEDDQVWLKRHQRWIEAEGFEVCCFQTATEAIDCVKSDVASDRLIRFAVIDHILLTVGDVYDPQELQCWQGMDAIAEIWRVNPDLIFVFVTDAPKIWNERNYRTLVEGISYLRNTLDGIPIHSVILKDEILGQEEKAYRNLTGLFWQWLREGNKQPSLTLLVSSNGIVNINSQINQQAGMRTLEMTEINFDRTGIVNLDSTIHHQTMEQHNYSASSAISEVELKEIAVEICNILTQVAGSQPIFTIDEQEMIAEVAKQEIEQQPALQQRIVGALRAGSVEALKQACQHPVAEVAIATFEGWLKP